MSHVCQIRRMVKSTVQRFLPGAILRRYQEKRLYSSFIHRGDLCFDIGANIGDKTAVFLSLGAKVVAVEPQVKCICALRRRFNGKDVVIVPCALGKEEGEGILHIGEEDTLSSLSHEWIQAVTNSGRFTKHRWIREELVKITTLDSLILQFGKPSFCKIDVEGFEDQVLSGLSTPIPFVSFEWAAERSEVALRCIEILSSLGDYVYNFLPGGATQLSYNRWVDRLFIERMISTSKGTLAVGDIFAVLTTTGYSKVPYITGRLC